ncbi:cupin domain-containing protein [Paenarthrobacter sp. YAF11_1]|uniref:cupin domain-containing protein n=1 Tax=Paenarthrobacter sp. YAF11_1 TaxID=3233074 RepID=UPI003F9C5C4C
MTDTATQVDQDALPEGPELESYDAKIKQEHIIGQWTMEPLLDAAVGGPKPRGVGHVWPWSLTRERLGEASKVLGPRGIGRCSIVFLNPGITQGPPGSTHTLAAGVQVMRAQEVCWSHRHTMSALRFIIEGNSDAFTVVDGEPLTMNKFDLLLTPRMAWHDHHNPTDSEVVWLDVLDLGLTLSLNQAFFEPFGDASQPQRPTNADSQGLRSRLLRPVGENPRSTRLPIRYAWADIEPVLDEYADTAGDAYDGLALRYANPVTGGPTMPTMDCWIQQLVPGFEGKLHRRTTSSVGFVISGKGSIEIEGKTHELVPGDTFAVPNYAWHRLSNGSDEPLRLFTVHDLPVIQSLGLLYEEPEATIGTRPAPAVPGIPQKQTYRVDAMLDRDEVR